ncbi:ATP-dependent RNA helicase MAK5 [Scheffersomyces xylosifermentans]|uniref:ATP-dependent RNA helicase MAK5 n=1 Tax=Scheffersomyces xylosifermentans TaxID=1304137 RepID=UPI00315C63D8
MAPNNKKPNKGTKKFSGSKKNSGNKKSQGNKKNSGDKKTTSPNKKKTHQVRKIPTLKQKLKRESKVVKVDNLLWKPVEVPDNLDDWEGFYGLEEIDGVDVKVVDGVAKFIVKEDVNEEEEEDREEEGEEENEQEAVVEENAEIENSQDKHSDDEEFTGFGDENEEDDVATNSNDEEMGDVLEEDEEDEEVSEEENIEEDEQSEGNDNTTTKEELLENVFHNATFTLPDDDINLPHWQDSESNLSLSPYTLHGLSVLGFDKPTPIQKKTIPIAMEGKDVVGKAITGSGKTLAYGIPILERYLGNLETINSNRQKKIINSPTGIIFAPTRELAHQVVNHLNTIAKYSPLSQNGIVSITGGLSIQKQERLLAHGPGVLVATPGRFLELIQKDEELAKRLSCTDIIVLDEADRLLQDGHFEEFETILELFRKSRPKNKTIGWKWQTLVFSATFSRDLFGKLDKHQKSHKKTTSSGSSLIDNEEILTLLNEKLKFKDTKPALIDANPKEIVSGQVTEALVECGATERDLYLYYFLLMYKGTTLVFANSIDSVKRLVPFLNNLNIPAFSIHSSMIQKQRLRSLERFQQASENNEIAVLIASDVAARGLDIPNIDHVAHYHLPRSADIYIHRSGRTARAGKEGVSVMFCSPQESSGPLRKLRRLVASNSNKNSKLNMHNDVKLLPIEMDLVSQLKPRVVLASKLADAAISNTSTTKEDSWVKAAAEELGVDDLADLENFEDDFIKKQRKRKEGKMLTNDEKKRIRYELKQLLSTTIRKNSRRSYLTSGLQNLAHEMVTGGGHDDVLGHAKVNALQDIQGKKKEKKGKKESSKPNKVTKPKKNNNNSNKSKSKK